MPRLAAAADRLYQIPFFIDDAPALSVLELRSRARRLMREHAGVGLIIVDYLQLMRGPARIESREQEISMISRSLEALAKELGLPVVALSQLNRAVEARADKRAMLSDLRESGAIQQDADLIAFRVAGYGPYGTRRQARRREARARAHARRRPVAARPVRA